MLNNWEYIETDMLRLWLANRITLSLYVHKRCLYSPLLKANSGWFLYNCGFVELFTFLLDFVYLLRCFLIDRSRRNKTIYCLNCTCSKRLLHNNFSNTYLRFSWQLMSTHGYNPVNYEGHYRWARSRIIRTLPINWSMS